MARRRAPIAADGCPFVPGRDDRATEVGPCLGASQGGGPDCTESNGKPVVGRQAPDYLGRIGHARSVPTHSLAEIGAAVVDALPVARAQGAAIVVSAPGPTIDAVADAIAASISTVHGEPVIVRTLRTDRLTPGSLVARRARARGVGVEIVVDAQWADDESLHGLLEPAHPLVVLVRSGAERRELADLRRAARRASGAFDVAPWTVDDLVGAGCTPQRAAELVAATGGLPELVAELEGVGTIVEEVTARLAVLDHGARAVAELVAFGLDPDGLLAHDALGIVAGADVDAILGVLAVEGVLIDGRMPPAVAEAVRAVCPPSRRAAVATAIADRGPAGARSDLAAALLAPGDRSPAAAARYCESADELAAVEPHVALRFADAAVAAGVDPGDLAVCRGVARLALGDPTAALRELHDVDAADVELVRAGAWAALGDLEAAAACLARSLAPQLRTWALAGVAALDADAATVTAGDADAASSLALALHAWYATGDGPAVLDELRRAVLRSRADPGCDRWPVLPDLVLAWVACRFGEFQRAEQAITAAIAERVGGGLHVRTSTLSAAWISAHRGHLDAAVDALRDVAVDIAAPHDRLIAAAAQCAVAVRDAEGAGLDDAIREAAAALDGVGVHLYDLDLVADVAAACSRAGAPRTDPLAPLHRLAGSATAPAHFRVDVAWAALRSAIGGDDLDAVRARASAVLAEPVLEAHDLRARVAHVLAAPERVGTGADVGEVIAIARELATRDHAHEAARLCGLVALATPDDTVARRLLAESRTWRSTRCRLRSAPGIDRTVTRLSEQEERIARLVIDGHTHKQIGAALFVSPKTVEHHVAHIRTKLGCANRVEMLAALRDYLGAT